MRQQGPGDTIYIQTKCQSAREPLPMLTRATEPIWNYGVGSDDSSLTKAGQPTTEPYQKIGQKQAKTPTNQLANNQLACNNIRAVAALCGHRAKRYSKQFLYRLKRCHSQWCAQTTAR